MVPFGGNFDLGGPAAAGTVAGVGGARGVAVDRGVHMAAFEMDGEVGLFW